MQLPGSSRIETQIRASFNIIDIAVRLLELNMLQKYPPVVAACNSHSEQTFFKGFETLLVCILTTISLPGNF